MPRISVVIPFHNREGTLARCLESLLEQDFPAADFEIVAVDNNSADGSGLVARQYSRVVVLQERTQGSYAARNCGLRHATGEIIVFTDSDCVAASDWLSRIERAMRDASLHVLIGKSQPAGQSRAVRLLGAYEEHKDRYVFSTTRSEKYYGHTSNMAVRREVFAQMGPFVEWQRGADAAFVRKAVDKFGCDAIRYDPDIFVRHLELESAVTYFKKAYAYGRARQLGNRVIHIEALSTAERFRIFQNTTRQQALSLMDTGTLLTLLVIGAGCWYAGNFSATAVRSVVPQ
jgi:glycosyltransferase involved in cell wall biosynthesis